MVTKTFSSEEISYKEPLYDRFYDLCVVCTSNTGVNTQIIKPWIYQNLMSIKNGEKLGVTVIEPSGGLAQDVADMCRDLDIPCVHVDPMNPDSDKFNIMQGNAEEVTETIQAILKDQFSRQDAFFAQVQQTAAKNTILLLKRLKGDDLDLIDVVWALRDVERLDALVKILKSQEGDTDLVQYFENELLGSMRDKYQQFAIGLRQQLEDITGGGRVRSITSGNSSMDLEEHLAEGGVLVVNTAAGVAGRAFSELISNRLSMAMSYHLDKKKTPHLLVVDESFIPYIPKNKRVRFFTVEEKRMFY